MHTPEKAIYALSADPVTNGHINIIERSIKMFGSLMVAVGNNPQKKYVFDKDERVALIRRALFPRYADKLTKVSGKAHDFSRGSTSEMKKTYS